MENKETFELAISPILDRIRKAWEDEAVFSFPVNLNRKGEIQDSAVIFGKKALYLAPRDGEKIAHYPFSGISNARFEAFLGGAVCEIEYNGEWVEFCRAFAQEKENISQLVRVIKEVSDGVLQPEEASFTYRLTLCPKCQRPLRRGSLVCSACEGKNGSFQKLFDLVRPHFGWIVLSIVLFFVTSALEIVLPVIQRNLVDGYLLTDDPKAVLDSYSSVLLVVLSLFAVRISHTLISVLRNNVIAVIGNCTVVTLRQRLYTNIQNLSVAGISRRTAGDLMNRISSDTSIISTFITSQLPNLLEQMIVVVSISIFFFVYSWRMAIMILLPVPFVILIFQLIWNRNRKLYGRQWVENSKANTVLHDIFQGVRVVKVFGTEKREIEKYERAIRTQRDISYRNEKAWARVVPFAEFVLQIGNFILLYYVGNHILQGNMTIGELTMFSSFVSLIYTPLRSMANFPRSIQQAMTAVHKVFEVIEEEPDVADAKDAKKFQFRGKIQVDRVWFGYNEQDNVIEDVSVTVEPGEMLGIVGRSGVGKSTLINLIMRLYDVNRGSISIDGVNVKDIAQHCLRSQIGVVLQETFLFAGTVFENLAYAKPEAGYDEVIQAARLANAHEFIMKLPDGYDTVVGEKGYTLSGGERQRIAIARAILHDPKILILDEATSALDTETEKLIQDALQRLCKNRTTIAIAHRLSTLRNATKLLVLDQKTVAEIGTHEELTAKEGGIYQGLVLAQREMSSIRKSKA